MDKRTYKSIVSPQKLLEQENNCKKIKISQQQQLDADQELLDGLCFDDDDDDFLMDFDIEDPQKVANAKFPPESFTLDLTSFKRCRVEDVQVLKNKKILIVLEKSSMQSRAKCSLKESWSDTQVEVGCIVQVKGAWDESARMFTVTNKQGSIVTSSDNLVSGTTLVGSLFCTRKSMLAEKFRAIIGVESMIMHIGTIVHEILQSCLRQNLTTLDEIRKVADSYLHDKNILQVLFACRLTLDDIKTEIDPFLDRIHEFIRQFIVCDGDSKVVATNQNIKQFEGRIADIVDIEENLWSPRLGLKGKIDVTVKVHPRNNFFNDSGTILPLEVKTGRASFSLEHKGQLIVYQMMMEDLGRQVKSGLLLYIKDGVLGEVNAPQAEVRGLLQMRNRLVHFMSKDIVNNDAKVSLPEPINHHSACGRCEYNVVCSSFLQREKNVKIAENNPLVKLNLTSHLSSAHLDYFIEWCRLIGLELTEGQNTIKLRHIWTKTPAHRAAKGNALINLKIVDLVQPLSDGEFAHKLQSETEFNARNFNSGDYVIVSTNSRCSIAAGRILEVRENSVILCLPRDLSVQYGSEKLHVDQYESQSQSVFNYSSIGALLDDKPDADRLRRIIIDKEVSWFLSSLSTSFVQLTGTILSKLNSMQRKAVVKAVTCQNYCLIKGYAGAGKSQTLVAFVRVLMALKKTILITSHTNSAVDNLLNRIKGFGFKFMRIGSISRVHPDLREYHESNLIKDCTSVEDLERVYSKCPIIGVTCLGSGHSLLSRRKFDYCLVDEATQIFQPTSIRPLFSADKFVLVGDPQQLSPLVRNAECRKSGGDQSLFERLDNPESTFVLGLQYRMNRVITKLANNLTYGGELKCGNEEVEKASMQVPELEKFNAAIAKEKWMWKVLSTHIDQSCILIDTGDVQQLSMNFIKSFPQDMKLFEEKSINYKNACEAAIALHLVKTLVDGGVNGESIGVIAPYRSQVEILKKSIKSHPRVEVNTVDQYQGRDKEIIIYSCTQMQSTGVENGKGSSSDVEILEDRKRLTVAITRAKHKLIMIGNVECLEKFTPFKDLFNHINKISKVSLANIAWESHLSHLKNELLTM